MAPRLRPPRLAPPEIITIVVFTEIAVWNVYGFLDVFTREPRQDYVQYLVALTPPFLLLLAVNALDRDGEDGESKSESFRKRMRLAYFFMGGFILLHLLPWFRVDTGEYGVRGAAIALLFAAGWLRRDALVYAIGVVWLISLVRRIQLGF